MQKLQNENMKELSFFKYYNEISSTELFSNNFSSDLKKVCKFCKKTSADVTFKSKPHVLPELFGRNNFTSNDECDLCNLKFGRHENDLSNFISPYQTLISQKTKNGIPDFQGRKKMGELSTTIININGSPSINFQNNITDFNFDYSNNVFIAKFKKKKFIPANVYKSLVKIGISLCPNEEITAYSKTLDWLLSDQLEGFILDIPFALFRTKFSKKMYKSPSATLFKRKHNANNNAYYPNLSLLICSGIMTYQLFIPFCSETNSQTDNGRKINLEIFPAFMYELEFQKGQTEISIASNELPIIQYDLNFNAKCEEDELVKFSYTDIIRNKH